MSGGENELNSITGLKVGYEIRGHQSLYYWLFNISITGEKALSIRLQKRPGLVKTVIFTCRSQLATTLFYAST